MTKLSAEQKKLMVDEYSNDKTCAYKTLGSKYGVTPTTVSRVVKAAGAERTDEEISLLLRAKLPEDEIIAKYHNDETQTIYTLAHDSHRSKNTIWRMFKRRKVKIRKPSCHSKNIEGKVNDNKETEKKTGQKQYDFPDKKYIKTVYDSYFWNLGALEVCRYPLPKK